MTIILDRAHGSNVAGKRSPDGRREWEWSQQMIDRLMPKLEAAGIEVVNIVTEETEPGLKERVRRMNSVPCKATVLSLHNNAAGMGDKWMNARGWSIYTTKGVTRSDRMATELYTLLRQKFALPFRTDFSDGDPDYEENFTVLTSKHPSVMLEWMFQDNKEDIEVIWDEKTNEALADVLVLWCQQIQTL